MSASFAFALVRPKSAKRDMPLGGDVSLPWLPFTSRCGRRTKAAIQTFICENSNAIWVRGSRASATGDYLKSQGWHPDKDYEEIVSPDDQKGNLDVVYPGASQIPLGLATLFTARGTFSGAGCS